MKKFLNLLFLLVTPLMTSYSIHLNSQINKRQTTQKVPSLQELIKTINIGRIASNTEENIILGLRNYQRNNLTMNAISNFLINQYNNQNLIIQEINHNFAIVHLNNPVRFNDLNTGFVADTIEFTINFQATCLTVKSFIKNVNLKEIESNSSTHILARVYELNNEQIYDLSLNINLIVINITQTTAIITSNSELVIGEVEVNFQTNRLLLSTMNLNTNLAPIPNFNSRTIISAFFAANPELPQEELAILQYNNSCKFSYCLLCYFRTTCNSCACSI